VRFVTYSRHGEPPTPGIECRNGAVIDVAAVLGHNNYPSVARLIGAEKETFDRLASALAAAEDGAASLDNKVLAPGTYRLHSPLGERVLIVCAGANYRSHLAEMGEEPSGELAWFVKNPNAVIGPGEPIILPPALPEQVDYEGELCIVFGRACHAVSEEDAMSYVGGYTILNDVSARDALASVMAASTGEQGRYAWMNMLLGKQFPTFSPLGPAVVTADEIEDPSDLQLVTTVNGTQMQNANTADLSVGIPELIAKLSRYFNFAPGDVLSTGTPAGVGAGRKPPVYLQPGDIVEVAVKGVGSLVNVIAASSTSSAQNNTVGAKV
jgi:2-keto-4-pentenoate hydratase/2-oxohepta-3-ene-1,7-dioic acid hydratase in catechol pathway